MTEPTGASGTAHAPMVRTRDYTDPEALWADRVRRLEVKVAKERAALSGAEQALAEARAELKRAQENTDGLV